GYYGVKSFRQTPPKPDRAVVQGESSAQEEPIFTGEDIRNGQNVWQSMGGHQVGSVWGHGSYVAPDWTADWLHREAVFILDRWAQADFGSTYAQLDGERQAQLRGRLAQEMRTKTYDPQTRTTNGLPNLAATYLCN